ncbi:Hypothetical protein, putative [Bodo saltans]|uniref:Macro domain-containing protein n=1 Tax=Bodo saltans TaxID=75058 RepID=A0A0S4JHA3_BODSA|nr:Hypothetical protein, putative [Bodo saltans]|eukprot:CUG89896.1 Hypothetical protein, putative [Bodo saltans]
MKGRFRMFGGFFSSRKAWTEDDEREYQLRQQALEEERKEKVQILRKHFEELEAIEDAEEYLNAKREDYYCEEDYWRLEDIPTWTEYAEVKAAARRLEPPRQPQSAAAATTAAPAAIRMSSSGGWGGRGMQQPMSELRDVDKLVRFLVNDTVNHKVSLFQGDITTLEIDAIVNAANSSLRGGGGIDGAIHNAAGDLLYEECVTLEGCPTGYTKVTNGYDLPAQFVLHTVGPMGRGDDDLERCYLSVLDHILASHKLPTHGDAVIQAESRRVVPSSSSMQMNASAATSGTNTLVPAIQTIAAYDPTTFKYRKPIRSLGICCISTGIFSFPRVRATHIALRTVRRWLEVHHDLVDRVVFVVFGKVDLDVYDAMMPAYFPVVGTETDVGGVCPPELLFPFNPPVVQTTTTASFRAPTIAPIRGALSSPDAPETATGVVKQTERTSERLEKNYEAEDQRDTERLDKNRLTEAESIADDTAETRKVSADVYVEDDVD